MHKELKEFFKELEEISESKDWEPVFQRVKSAINDNGLHQFDLKVSFRKAGSGKKWGKKKDKVDKKVENKVEKPKKEKPKKNIVEIPRRD